ncbi:hypothetical protein AGMMS50218_01080 [Actinomycetota bacterium]|nr:hypothetical protein AGMMS50218_01080 [Actinomycetota bacterium]
MSTDRIAAEPSRTAEVGVTGALLHAPAPRVLYLDMNLWVDMARGCAQAEPSWLQVRDHLIQAAQAGHIVVPLSPAHYLELWHRRDSASRRQVAELMKDVTAYATIPSLHVVRQHEARGLVGTWADPSGSMPTGTDLLGHGAAHAFGRPYGRFRFVENTASSDGAVLEGPAVDPTPEWEKAREHPGWEWFQLYGLDEAIPEELGFDRTPEHRFGSQQLDHEIRVRDWLRSHPQERRRHQDMVVAEEFESVREYVEAVCHETRVRPPEALRTGNWGPESAEAVRGLVRSIPSADAWSTLRFLKHRDLNLPWEQHDWTDMWSLSVAIPYCDAVVTEKRWAHLATVGGLGRRYETSVGYGRHAVERELESARDR